jgi:hypothetical protein
MSHTVMQRMVSVVAVGAAFASGVARAQAPPRQIRLEVGTLRIDRAAWQAKERRLEVAGRAPAGASVVVRRTTGTAAVLGTVVASRSGGWRLEVSDPQPVPCRVRAEAAGLSAERAVEKAPSDCDAATPALLALTVSGPAQVAESATAQFTATAAFADGSTRDATAQAAWSEDSAFATIGAGVLTTSAVTGDQPVTVSASLTEAGVTRSGSVAVTIDDAPAVTGSHAGRFTSFEGTRTCLTCHLSEAQEMHGAVHYQWLGDASESTGLDSSRAGKLGGINDFCIYPDINWIGKLTTQDGAQVDGGCARCHAGLGAKPSPEATQVQLENIDCLLCHSPSYKRTVAPVDGQLRFVPDTAAMSVSLLQAAVDIRRPTSDTCLNCHTKAGGGNNYKRGDLEEAHRTATPDLDAHLASKASGGAGLTCLSCHVESGHRIAGRGVDMRERDLPDPVRCENCHGAAPHESSTLDRHTARVDCTSCHIPAFARVAATDMVRDWSLPGEVDPTTRLYEPHMVKASHVTPEYRFWNGRSEFYQFGSTAVPGADGRVVMAGPLGSIGDVGAKIFPFKHHTGRQPAEPGGRLLPLKIGIFFSTGNIAAAIVEGANAVGWAYGGHEFADTERWMGIFHEVAPHEQALECANCHEGATRLDFAALGYTPKETRNGKPLCTSCHGSKEEKPFYTLHDKHVRDKKLDCSNCHTFAAAVR